MGDETWTIEKSRLVYGLGKNDLHFLDITENGELCISFNGQRITFAEIIKQIKETNGEDESYTSSFTLRIPQLITSQMQKLIQSFRRAMNDADYQGKFSAVYPVKVNQRFDVVSAVIASDENYGLEAGTKAELLLIKSLVSNERHRRIVCNGAKDPEYLQMIKRCIDEGYNMSVSIESVHEAKFIVDVFEPDNIDLVLRMKPYLKVEGHWSHSTGRDSKFGLSIHDLYDVIEILKERSFINSVSTLMAHVGSQVTDMFGFHSLGSFMTEIFYELRERGLLGLDTIDFGGGLPIDYTSANPENLMRVYATSIVEGIEEVREHRTKNTPYPNIMVEAGRGITALYAMVVVKGLEVRSVYPRHRETWRSEILWEESNKFSTKLDTLHTLDDIVRLWNEFHIEHTQKSHSLEGIYESELIVGQAESWMRAKFRSLDLRGIGDVKLVRSFWHPSHLVIGNFSVFNSIADYVLVDQHFPITPIKGLHKRPETTVRLVDITCDSDGEFSQFHLKDTEEIWYTEDDRPVTMPGGMMSKGIPIGKIQDIEGLYFVIGLIGAYQDAIEMDHNLLGDLPDVGLVLTETNEWQVRWMKGAEAIEEILEDQGYTDLDIDKDPYM